MHVKTSTFFQNDPPTFFRNDPTTFFRNDLTIQQMIPYLLCRMATISSDGRTKTTTNTDRKRKNKYAEEIFEIISALLNNNLSNNKPLQGSCAYTALSLTKHT